MCKHGTETELLYSVRQNNDWDKWKTIKVDSCISDLITKLRNFGIETLGSCCGHSTSCGSVVIWINHVQLARSLGYDVVCYWRRSITGDYQMAEVLQKNNCNSCKYGTNYCHCTCHFPSNNLEKLHK